MKFLVIIVCALCVLVFNFGILIGKTFSKESDGRLVIVEDKDDYFVAITTPTDTIKEKSTITLDVYITKSS